MDQIEIEASGTALADAHWAKQDESIFAHTCHMPGSPDGQALGLADGDIEIAQLIYAAACLRWEALLAMQDGY